MQHQTLAIKNWIAKNISPLGWRMVIARWLPELLAYHPDFLAYYLNKPTVWSETELNTERMYLSKMYPADVPEQLTGIRQWVTETSSGLIASPPRRWQEGLATISKTYQKY